MLTKWAGITRLLGMYRTAGVAPGGVVLILSVGLDAYLQTESFVQQGSRLRSLRGDCSQTPPQLPHGLYHDLAIGSNLKTSHNQKRN